MPTARRATKPRRDVPPRRRLIALRLLCQRRRLVADVDVDWAQHNGMFARVSRELRRRIEAHRLATGEGGQEGVGMVTLEPIS